MVGSYRVESVKVEEHVSLILKQKFAWVAWFDNWRQVLVVRVFIEGDVLDLAWLRQLSNHHLEAEAATDHGL